MSEVAGRSRVGRWEIAYALVSVLCLGTTGYATYRIATLEGSATFLEDRLKSQASDYEVTLQARFVDQEMQSFRERHELLSESTAWWQLRLGLMIFWVLGTFAFYIHRVIARFSEEVTEQPQPTPVR